MPPLSLSLSITSIIKHFSFVTPQINVNTEGLGLNLKEQFNIFRNWFVLLVQNDSWQDSEMWCYSPTTETLTNLSSAKIMHIKIVFFFLGWIPVYLNDVIINDHQLLILSFIFSRLSSDIIVIHTCTKCAKTVDIQDLCSYLSVWGIQTWINYSRLNEGPHHQPCPSSPQVLSLSLLPLCLNLIAAAIPELNNHLLNLEPCVHKTKLSHVNMTWQQTAPTRRQHEFEHRGAHKLITSNIQC